MSVATFAESDSRSKLLWWENSLCFSAVDQAPSSLCRKCLSPRVHGMTTVHGDTLVLTPMGKYSQYMTDTAIKVKVDREGSECTDVP